MAAVVVACYPLLVYTATTLYPQVPALFLFLGIGPATMVTVVVFAAVFPVLINVYQGVRGMDPVLGETARTFGCSRWRAIRSVVLPATLPAIFTGMKVSLSLGIVLAVLAEMLAGQSGLGFIILDTQRAFQTDQMYAWVVVLAAFGAACSLLFDRIERLAIPCRRAKLVQTSRGKVASGQLLPALICAVPISTLRC